MARHTLTRREKRLQDMARTLLRVAHGPLSSAADLEGYGDYTLPTIHSLMDMAVAEGFAGMVRVGQSFSTQDRAMLFRKGVDFIRETHGLRPTWQMSQASVPFHFKRLRFLEVLNRLAPRLFRCGAVRVPAILPLRPRDTSREMVLDENTDLVEMTLHQDVSKTVAHAIGRYRTSSGQDLWLPFVWVGLHHADIEASDDLTAFLEGLDTRPGFRYRLTPAAPMGVVFIVIDRLAGLSVRLKLPNIPKAIVTADGELVQQLDPVPPVGVVASSSVEAAKVGHPERAFRKLESDNQAMALHSRPACRVFEWVNQYPGTEQTYHAMGVGQPPARCTRSPAA